MTDSASRSSASASGPHYRWVVMGLVWALDMGITIGAFSYGILLPDMAKDLGMSPVQSGWLGATFWMAIAILSIPCSLYLSHLSPKLVRTVVAFAGGAALILQGFAPTYELEFIARVLFVGGVVARVQAAILLIQQWFEIREVVKVNALQSALLTLAQVFALGFVPILLFVLNNWRNAYFFMGVLLLGTGILWIIFGKENSSHQYRARLASQDGNPIKALKKYRVLWLVASCQIGSALAWTAFLTFWPTFLYTFRDIPLATAGLLMSLLPLGSILGSFSSNYLSLRLGLRKPIIIVPGVLLPFSYLAMLYWSEPVLLGVFSFFTGYLCYVVVPIIMAYPYEMAGIKPREVAVGNALIATLATTGGSVGPIVAGFIQQSTESLQIALTVCSIFAVSLAISGYFLPETGWLAHRKKPEEQSN